MTSETNLNFEVSENETGLRLDTFLTSQISGWSRSRLQKLIDNEEVLVNQKKSKSSYKLRLRDEIEVELNETIVEKIEPENIPLEPVYEDEDILVINKQSGLVVHTGAGVYSGTLANAVAYHCGNFDENSTFRSGIVHRLDKLTSGLIVVAKNIYAHENLSEQFRNREVFKSYLALVHGNVREDSGIIKEAIARDRNNRTKMAVSSHGRHAYSAWQVKRRFDNFTLLDVTIKTGRTHQIRVHLGHLKHGVVGDELYNGGRDQNVQNVRIRKAVKNLNRFFLHAEKLAFKHPRSLESLSFQSDLPEELKNFLGNLAEN